MSHIRKRGDIDTAMRLLRSTPDARRLTSDDMEALYNLAHERVDDPRAERWFDGFSKVYVEREVVSADGDLRRVDRVVWTGDGEIHVIDYKTGRQDTVATVARIHGVLQKNRESPRARISLLPRLRGDCGDR